MIPAEQHKIWSLEPDGGPDEKPQHAFLSINSGIQLHCLLRPSRQQSTRLIIFLHGFPDSSQVFAQYLSSPLADHATLVSLDLPGFGGSDGTADYGTETYLNTVVEAILLLRDRHLASPVDDDGPNHCILVGHDWGAAISARLAMETEGLIDRVVLMNGPIPQVFVANVRTCLGSFGKHLKTWWRSPFHTQLLCDARDAISPLLVQLFLSNYIFMFNTPVCTMRYFRFVGEYLISVCHKAAAGQKAEAWAPWSWAASIGPSVNECTTTSQSLSYGNDVQERSIVFPHGDWDTRIRLYKEGLFTGDWTLRTQQTEEVIQMKAGQKPCFRCPATIIWGRKDMALDYRMCVKGAEDYFRPANGHKEAESQIVLIEQGGHWSPLEDTGASVLRELLLELLGVNKESGDTSLEQPGIKRSDFR